MSSSSSPPTNLIDLPHDLVGYKILSRLPFKEAARTCVLSRSWRSFWRSVTNLDFSSSTSTPPPSTSSPPTSAPASPRFPASPPPLSTSVYADISFDVYPLAVNFRRLVRLHLSNFPALHLGLFTPFSSLRLLRIYFADYASGKQLSMLVSACPVLEELELRDVCTESYEPFDIVAPKLRLLLFDDAYLLVGFSITSAPLLKSASFVGMFGGTPSIQKVANLSETSLQLFETGYGPENVPIVSENLRFIRMDYHVPYDGASLWDYGALGVLCLLRSSPNLEDLEVEACTGNEKYEEDFGKSKKMQIYFRNLLQ